MKAFKKLLSVICAIVLFLAMFSVANFVLMRPDSRIKYTQFMEDDQSYDVLFFGSSHVINAISPLDLFHDYGFTSYNFSNHGLHIIGSYFQIAEIEGNFKEKLPKVIVLDVFGGGQSLSWTHHAWDAFPSDNHKWHMAYEMFERENRLEIMLPFALYHGRWNEALKNFPRNINKLYGVELRYGVRPPEKEIVKNRDDKKTLEDPIELDYLRKILAFCDKNEIDLILVNIPYSYHPERQREANAIYEFAAAHKLPYVNYMNEKIGIDFNIDFFDTGHVNPSGMRIMTNEIGKLLQQTTTLHDRRNEPIAKRWNEEYQNYINYRIDRLKGLKNTNEFLMACNDPDLTVRMEVNNKILTDKTKWLLIERLEKIKGNTIKKSFDKVTHTKADKKTQKCDISAVVFSRDSKKEVFRAAFSSSEKMK